MSTTPIDSVLLDAAQGLPPLTLLVHERPERLADEIAALRRAWGWPVVSVGRVLAEDLARVSVRRRGQVAQVALEAAIEHAPGEIVLLTDLALLFEPSLQLDALALLGAAARGRRLVVAWPGRHARGVLSCAHPDHAHHRTWSDPDASIHVLR